MRFLKRFRWSLRTQVLVVLFTGLLILIWERREPWESTNAMVELLSTGSRESPDGTRILTRLSGTYITISDISERNQVMNRRAVLCLIRTKHDYYEAFFKDDNTIAARTLVLTEDLKMDRTHFYQFKRRFPEWWWGHLYRPEVWLLPLWLGLIVWTIRKDRAVPK